MNRHAVRVLAHADRAENGCLVSRYAPGSHGYAQAWEGRVTLAHLVVWRALYGEPGDGMTVDHTCHNRLCVEPTHLRLLSNAENGRRNSADGDYPLGWTCKRNHGVPRNAQGKCPECRKIHHMNHNRKRRAL